MTGGFQGGNCGVRIADFANSRFGGSRRPMHLPAASVVVRRHADCRQAPKPPSIVCIAPVIIPPWGPAIMGIEGWFGTTAECIDAACTGVWRGDLA
ncbi:hypothetical protein [Novosphingobium capsulatum]|uniref:hypothetical protein n=2 Tax=Novosphingobium capsulatum TaxID=13688 RepID=UPI002E1032A0|nr:hypothetical protein U0041_10415 [Novosphingobium capsulatum]